jgi:glycosyltransferase involved in cell wall biosynthesis
MSADDSRTVLLVSNRRLDENAGRAAKFQTRAERLAERGWNLEVGYVEPTPVGTPLGIARNLRAARRADVINSVSNPPQLQIAGGILARLTGTPWIAEFRDPLVENPDVEPDSVAARIRRRLEGYILTHADRVVWYDGIQIPDDYFERTYPDVPSDRVRKLPPIGFDDQSFESVDPASHEEFTVTYAGSFYEGWIEPYTFLRGLSDYVESRGEHADVRAHFYGDWNESYAEAATNHGVEDYVEPHSFVPHEEIVAELKGSDALLYVGGDDPRNEHNLPSKLYDYIGARRPILAIVDPSFRVADVITENGFGIVVEPDDRTGVADALERIRSGDFEYAPDEADVERFTRSHSLDAYLEALNAVAGETAEK